MIDEATAGSQFVAAKSAMPNRIVGSIAATAALIGIVAIPTALMAWLVLRLVGGDTVRWLDFWIIVGFLAGVMALLVVVQDSGPLKPALLAPFRVVRLLRFLVERSLFGVGPLVGFTAWNADVGLQHLVQPRSIEELGRYRPGAAIRDLQTRPLPAARTRRADQVSERGGSVEQWSGPTADYTVVRGDTYWTLAERHLGDGNQWRVIRDMNLAREVATGVTLQVADDLRRGWSIVVPDVVQQKEEKPA